MAITQTIAVHAVHGLPGVGKTQLPVEYAWKHLRDYEAVLWVKVDSPEALDASLSAFPSAFTQSTEIDRKSLSPDNPDLAMHLQNFGHLLKYTDRLAHV